MILLRLVTIFVLFLVAAQAEDPAVAAANTALVYESVIPELEIDAENLTEALTQLGVAWREMHPDVPFAVGAVDFRLREEDEEDPPLKVWLSLKDVTFFRAMIYMGDLTGYRVREESDLFKFKEMYTFVGEGFTRVYELSETQEQSLEDISPDVKTAFEELGLGFEQGSAIYLSDGELIYRGEGRGHGHVATVLRLFEAGFQIVPPESENAGE